MRLSYASCSQYTCYPAFPLTFLFSVFHRALISSISCSKPCTSQFFPALWINPWPSPFTCCNFIWRGSTCSFWNIWVNASRRFDQQAVIILERFIIQWRRTRNKKEKQAICTAKSRGNMGFIFHYILLWTCYHKELQHSWGFKFSFCSIFNVESS